MYAHITEITSMAPIGHASAEKLGAMIDTVDEHLRMLKRFDIQTDHWSPIVCVLMLSKLDPDTRLQWETKEKLPDKPELSALFEFLRQRISAIRNVELSAGHGQQAVAGRPQQGNGKPNKPSSATSRYHPYERAQPKFTGEKSDENRRASDQKGPPPDCPMCGAGTVHFLWKCEPFKALTATQKEQELAKWGLCKVCLVAKHKPADCKRGICPVCKMDKHNSLVCPKRQARSVNHVRKGRGRRSEKQPE